jgi:hypothetical protein
MSDFFITKNYNTKRYYLQKQVSNPAGDVDWERITQLSSFEANSLLASGLIHLYWNNEDDYSINEAREILGKFLTLEWTEYNKLVIILHTKNNGKIDIEWAPFRLREIQSNEMEMQKFIAETRLVDKR